MNDFFPIILDTTLRDGEQTPGVVFSLEDKLNIAAILDKAGIQEAEIGTPAMGSKEIMEMHEISASGFSLNTISWCRALKSDIDLAAGTGTDGVHISFPTSAIHLSNMGKTEKWVIRSMLDLIPYALDKFNYVTVGFQDASRSDLRFLKECIHTVLNFNIKRVRIADTVGILNPFSTFDLIAGLQHDFSTVMFEFHGHNDLGMATANSIAAFKAGAVCIDTTVNGLGERAGNAPLDEFVMAAEITLGILCNINKIVFCELAELVSRVSGIPLPANKPVSGAGVLRHESGIHTSLLLKDRNTYQLISAESIGKTEIDFIFGKHSGMHALRSFAERHNMEMSEMNCRKLLNYIKSEAARLKRGFIGAELHHLIQQYHLLELQTGTFFEDGSSSP